MTILNGISSIQVTTEHPYDTPAQRCPSNMNTQGAQNLVGKADI